MSTNGHSSSPASQPVLGPRRWALVPRKTLACCLVWLAEKAVSISGYRRGEDVQERIRPLVGTPVPAVTRTGPSPGT